MVEVTYQRMAVFDINTLEKLSDAQIGDKDDFYFSNIELIWNSSVIFASKANEYTMPATYFMPFIPNQSLLTEESFRVEFSEEDEEKYKSFDDSNIFFNEAERDRMYVLKCFDKNEN